MTDDIVKLTKGARVSTKFGLGVVTDDYWRDRDRFRVRLDDGTEHDFCSASLREAARAAPERAVEVPETIADIIYGAMGYERTRWTRTDPPSGAWKVACDTAAQINTMLTAAPLSALVPSTGAVEVRELELEGVLAGLCSTFGAGTPSEPLTPASYDRRIREGVEITYAPMVEAWRRELASRGGKP